MPHRKRQSTPPPDPEIAALHERAEAVKRTSAQLIRQLKQLASEIAEQKAIREDARAKRR